MISTETPEDQNNFVQRGSNENLNTYTKFKTKQSQERARELIQQKSPIVHNSPSPIDFATVHEQNRLKLIPSVKEIQDLHFEIKNHKVQMLGDLRKYLSLESQGPTIRRKSGGTTYKDSKTIEENESMLSQKVFRKKANLSPNREEKSFALGIPLNEKSGPRLSGATLNVQSNANMNEIHKGS